MFTPYSSRIRLTTGGFEAFFLIPSPPCIGLAGLEPCRLEPVRQTARVSNKDCSVYIRWFLWLDKIVTGQG